MFNVLKREKKEEEDVASTQISSIPASLEENHNCLSACDSQSTILKVQQTPN